MTSFFITSDQARQLVRQHGSPLFVYSNQRLLEQARTMLSLPSPHGLTVRYAMKANPHPDILRALREAGAHIDASSSFEVERALAAGYAADRILLTSQQSADNLAQLVEQGMRYDATSLRQLELFGQVCPGRAVGVRINPGIGSGHSAKTNVGGLASSFGIWHEYIPQVRALAERYKLRITRLHTHIGSGADPAVWRQVASISLQMVEAFPEVHTLNLGGGFKVARMPEEQATDVPAIGEVIAREVSQFCTAHNRQLRLEYEPGTFLAANAGILIAAIDDIVDTGEQGYHFLKLNTGMTDILRPSLYGAQHPIMTTSASNEARDYIIVGHCCESGDLLTPAPGEPSTLQTRRLPSATIGDLVLIGGAGAYCASMAARGYNSFPAAAEMVID